MLKVKNLSYEINKRTILKDIDLCFNNGEIVVITGENGSGKTSLLKLIMGILPTKSGSIFLDDKEITNLKINTRANLGMSIAFQQPVKFKGLTVKKLLTLAEHKAQNINTACDYLSKVGLCARNYLDREFNESLSGGERKRIELAISLAQNAHTCLFDEPEAGIDMWSFEKLTNIFLELKKQKKCVVIVSHNDNILSIADKILVLNNSQIQYFGKPNNKLKTLLPSTCIKLKGGENE